MPLYHSATNVVITPPVIGFVNVANNNSSDGASSGSATYSPVAGNTVIAFLALAGVNAISTFVDSKGNSLTAGGSVVGATISLYCYYYTAPSGVTSFSASWTNTPSWNLTVVEYSGVTSINAAQAGNTNTGSDTSPTITNTSQDANDWIVAGLANHHLNNEISITVGNLRNKDAGVPSNLTVADNTSASPGSVTITGSQTTATAWAAVSIELRT